MRFASVSTGETLGRARELLKDRFRVMIRKLDTDATVRGWEREVSQVHGGEGLSEARARGSRFIRLRVSIAMFRLGCFYSELRLRSSMTKCLLRSIADEEKKKKHSYEYFFLDTVHLSFDNGAFEF